MNVLRLGLALCAALTCLPQNSQAITTNLGQSWTSEPDAWVRGNNAHTSWFGWDIMEGNNPLYPAPPNGFFRILDDRTPDIGDTTANVRRLFQGNDGAADPLPTINGHRSSSAGGNYYSFDDVANDTITALTPASGVGGFTTVVLQILGQQGNQINDLQFTVDPSWTLAKSLYNKNGDGAGMYWVEWYQAGGNLPFAVTMTSGTNHRGIDAFQVDTVWTPGSSPLINARTSIPEPGSIVLSGIGLLGISFAWRKRHAS